LISFSDASTEEHSQIASSPSFRELFLFATFNTQTIEKTPRSAQRSRKSGWEEGKEVPEKINTIRGKLIIASRSKWHNQTAAGANVSLPSNYNAITIFPITNNTILLIKD